MRQTLNLPAYERSRESSNSQVLLMNLPILQLQAPIGAIETAMRKPDANAGKAAGKRTLSNKRQGDGLNVLARSSQALGVLRKPS